MGRTNISKMYTSDDDKYSADDSCKQIFEYFGCKKSNVNIPLLVIILLAIFLIITVFALCYYYRYRHIMIAKYEISNLV